MKTVFSTRLTALCAGLLAAFAAQAAAPVESDAQTARVIVAFKPGSAAASAARAAISKAGGRVALEIIGNEAVAVTLPKKMLAALRAGAGIASVEDDVKRFPMALTTPTAKPYKLGQLKPYGIGMVQADKLPRGDLKTGNRKICIIDSGYDRTHEDLSGNDVDGEFDSGTGWWYVDGSHHGTHVAGTIAAMNNKGVGVVGVNPSGKIKLHIVKVFGDSGSWAYSSTLVNATKKCEAAGANVISMSLGGPLPSSAERTQFQKLADAGILSIAAAGNGGNSATSYPAGYPAVMSVAGVDEFKNKYTASQFNKDVEIAGPAVAVLSTVPMGTGLGGEARVGTSTYQTFPMEGSSTGSASGPLGDFGLGDKIDAAMNGKVCLIQRGNIDFSVKVKNCVDSGGVGAIVYNNVQGTFNGTLGTYVSPVPAVSASDTDGAAMKAKVGQATTLSVETSNYAYFDGTSMATPHVSGVAAQVWSYFPQCTGEQIRQTLNKSALDIGTPGRDNNFGYGIVQARAAYDRLKAGGCNN